MAATVPPPSSAYISWDSVKEFTHKAWSQAKDWMFGEGIPELHSVAYSDHKGASENRDYIKEFQDLLKERSELPPSIYRTDEQSKAALKIRGQLDELGYKIDKDPDLMKSAVTLGIESAVQTASSSHYVKLRQAREKTLGLDQGIGYEMALTRDRLFDQPRKKPNDES